VSFPFVGVNQFLWELEASLEYFAKVQAEEDTVQVQDKKKLVDSIDSIDFMTPRKRIVFKNLSSWVKWCESLDNSICRQRQNANGPTSAARTWK
jgi:hypothetical protein